MGGGLTLSALAVAIGIFVALLSLESFFLARAWRSFLKNSGTRFQLSLLELAVAPLCLFFTIKMFTDVFKDASGEQNFSENPAGLGALVLLAALMGWCQLIGAAFFLLRARSKFGNVPGPSVRGLLIGSILGTLQFIPFIMIAGRFVR